MPSKKSKKNEVFDDDQVHFWFVKKPVLDESRNCYVWDSVEVVKSTIPEAGEGLFAKRKLRVNTMIPYGGRICEDISREKKKKETISYVVYCGDDQNGMWIDGNPRLIADKPSNTWVGPYVNEASINSDTEYNAELFLWDSGSKRKIPKYPETEGHVFIRIKKTIQKGEEIFAWYDWNKRQQSARGYEGKPRPVWNDYKDEIINANENRSARNRARNMKKEGGKKFGNDSLVTQRLAQMAKAKKDKEALRKEQRERLLKNRRSRS